MQKYWEGKIIAVALTLIAYAAVAGFCPECGRQNSEANKFCVHCGKKLAAAEDAISADQQNGEIDKLKKEIVIRSTIKATRKGKDEWKVEPRAVNTSEPTFVDLRRAFEELMWDEELDEMLIEHLFKRRFLILDKGGDLAFAYGKIKVYIEDRSKKLSMDAGSDKIAVWQNDIKEKTYRLEITGKAIVIEETQ